MQIFISLYPTYTYIPPTWFYFRYVYIIIYDDICCSTNCIFKCAHGKNGIHTLRSEVLLIHIYTKLSRVWKSQVARQERRKRIINLNSSSFYKKIIFAKRQIFIVNILSYRLSIKLLFRQYLNKCFWHFNHLTKKGSVHCTFWSKKRYFYISTNPN